MTAREQFNICKKNFLEIRKNYMKWVRNSQLRKLIKSRGNGTESTQSKKL